MTAELLGDDVPSRRHAVAVLRAGGLVAFPTDTVYGLAADLRVPGAVARLFAAKDRPSDRAIVLLLADAAQAGRLAVMSPAATQLSTLWPGGLTLVCRQRPDRPLPDNLTGGRSTIGLRVPAHAAPRALARGVGPLPTTSANRSGAPDSLDAATVMDQLGTHVDLVLDGGLAAAGVPSTVVDCSVGRARVIRAGAVAVRRLADLLDGVGIAHDLEPVPRSTAP